LRYPSATVVIDFVGTSVDVGGLPPVRTSSANWRTLEFDFGDC
jgi:hypothetical protein